MLQQILTNIQSFNWVNALTKCGNVYLVGGAVRDALTNKSVKDIDLVVEGMTLKKITKILEKFGAVNVTGISFSVIKFRPIGHVGEDFDIALPREDKKTGSGHKGFSVFTKNVSLELDLKRRDFTINSIAVNVKTGEFVDPFNGLEDLKNKVLRATDITAFSEDPLRILRAIQFSSRFRFTIESETLELMKSHSPLIQEISGERIKGEFDKILLKQGSTKIAFELLEKCNLDLALFDKKFVLIDDLEDLDLVSFYYKFGTLGGQVASDFYKDRLKGEYDIFKAILTLEKFLAKYERNIFNSCIDEWDVFMMLKSSPILEHCKILPYKAQLIIEDMLNGNIPMKMGDIPVSGNEIMQKFNISGKSVGKAIETMYMCALVTKKFDWRDKNDTLNYLEKYAFLFLDNE